MISSPLVWTHALCHSAVVFWNFGGVVVQLIRSCLAEFTFSSIGVTDSLRVGFVIVFVLFLGLLLGI